MSFNVMYSVQVSSQSLPVWGLNNPFELAVSLQAGGAKLRLHWNHQSGSRHDGAEEPEEPLYQVSTFYLNGNQTTGQLFNSPSGGRECEWCKTSKRESARASC